MKQKHLLLSGTLFFYGLALAVSPASPGDRAWDIAANVEVLACTIESKVCALDFEDFSETFTIIDDIIKKECSMSSQIDVIQSELENFTFDFDGTYTAIEEVLLLACTISSELDASLSLIEVIQEAFGFPITNELVGTSGFTITEGGEYYLAEDIVFNPSSTDLAAITIDADNTFIDFKLKTLSTDGTSGTVGVELLGTHTNVQISNGVITNTDAQAILINELSADVVVDNMLINDVANESGIEVVSTGTDIFFTNVIVTNCNEHGILTNASSSMVLRNCVCSDNGNGIGNGMLFTDCSEITLHNCIASNNTDNGLEFSSSTTSENITLFECTTWDNDGYGILFSHISNSLISGVFSKGNTLDGIHLEDALRISITNNCCENNGRDNIRLATESTGTQNCYIGQNSLVLTSSVNLREESGSSQNGVFGNYALATSTDKNYVSIGGGSFFNQATVNQSGSFPATEPTFWNNINMIT
ncbi:MAG: right-handed parallel beta-helix repeat-containing protein [Candidatus Dependentiae bacterium]